MSINSEIADVKSGIDSLSFSYASSIVSRAQQIKDLISNPGELTDEEVSNQITVLSDLMKQEISYFRNQLALAKTAFTNTKNTIPDIKDTIVEQTENTAASVKDYKDQMDIQINNLDTALNTARDAITDQTQQSFV